MASKKNEVVRFEDLLRMVGENSRWQINIFLFLWIEGILIGFHHLSSVFLGASNDHWCQTSHLRAIPNSWTTLQRKEYAIPKNEDGNFESCMIYDLEHLRNIPQDFSLALARRPRSLNKVSCVTSLISDGNYYQYNTSSGINSIVNNWNLVCDRLPLLSTVQGSYMGGVFVGCILFGWFSDRYGRRTTILVSLTIQIVSTIAAAFSVNYIMFIGFRFLIALSVSGVFECGFVLVTEICGAKFRTIFGILTQFPFGIGASLLPLVAYFIRDWSYLQLAISIPSILLVSYYWLIPESPRWLITERRFEEAVKILRQGATVNQNSLPSDEELIEMMENFEELEEEQNVDVIDKKTKKEKLYELFKEIIRLVETPEMRRRSIYIVISWLIVAMVYYGISFNTKNLGGNLYLSVFISGFVEVPAVVVIIPLLARFGRVYCYSGSFIGTGLFCIAVAVATIAGRKDLIWIPVTLAMSGKFLISMAFAIAYLYTAELFPTTVRNVAVGASSTFARIGSMIAPYIVDLLGVHHAAIPVTIFGIISVLGGGLTLMLPETLNKKMPETVAEVEQHSQKSKQSHDCEMRAQEDEDISVTVASQTKPN